MKCMEINKRGFWYAPYLGKEEIVRDGKRTGQYTVKYGTPVNARAVISPARGGVNEELFGVNAVYDRTITTEDVDIGIDEMSVLWIDKKPGIGADGATETPWDYVVEKVARSLNSVSVAVKKVSVQ